MRLLIVEDDVQLANVLALGFGEEGFAVDVASNGPEGLRAAASGDHDAVVLDVMLPGLDGFSVVEALRRKRRAVPVLFLTARDAVEERVKGLQLGADDYVCKPFSFEELLARVRVLLRRAHGLAHRQISWRGLTMDMDARSVSWHGGPISLTPREMSLLEALLLNKGKAVSRSRLIEHLYDREVDRDFNVIDAHIANLRRKLRAVVGSPVIATVRGFGFRISEDTE